MNSDVSYDYEKAKTALVELESVGVEEGERRLSRATKDEQWINDITIVHLQKPRSWRLLKAASGQPDEELVFALHGVITDKDLPPMAPRGKHRQQPARYRYLRQSVTITGLGTDAFTDAINAGRDIHRLFDRWFPEGKLEDWVSDTSTCEISAANRYFTPKDEVPPGECHVAFGKQADPQGILEDMAKEGYVHTEDNMVQYFARKPKTGGGFRYEAMGPQAFRVGDLVTLQILFAVVPLRGDTYKMLTVLRSITLVDGSLQRTSKSSVPGVQQHTPSLKRKIRHADPMETFSPAREKKRGAAPEIMEVD